MRKIFPIYTKCHWCYQSQAELIDKLQHKTLLGYA